MSVAPAHARNRRGRETTIPDLLYVSEVVDLGISRSRVFELLKDGTFRRVKVGRRTKIPRSDVAGYLHDLVAAASAAVAS